MKLEGVVTNVTAFGAFVDIGVHQDGLVHISQLSDRFVDSPRDVVKAGDVVQVRVLDVDLEQPLRRAESPETLTRRLYDRCSPLAIGLDLKAGTVSRQTCR